jgi:hypothetical protein
VHDAISQWLTAPGDRPAARMDRTTMPARLPVLAAGALLVAASALLPAPAEATPPCGRGWRKGEYCGGPVHVAPPPPPPRPVYVVPAPPPPVVVAPPPVYVAPPRPGIGVHVDIPLR